jgi:hypothetical protein
MSTATNVKKEGTYPGAPARMHCTWPRPSAAEYHHENADFRACHRLKDLGPFTCADLIVASYKYLGRRLGSSVHVPPLPQMRFRPDRG